MEYNSCLLGVPIFHGLEVPDLVRLTQLIETIHIDKGSNLFEVGDELNHLYIVHSGVLKVYGLSENGTLSNLRVLSSGDFIGEQSLIQKQHSSLGVQALENASICKISRMEFTKLVAEIPHLSLKIIEGLLKRIKEQEDMTTQYRTLSARERILESFEKLQNENHRVVLNMTRKEYANTLGMSSETFSRQMKKLEDEGVLTQIDRNQIVLLQTPKNSL